MTSKFTAIKNNAIMWAVFSAAYLFLLITSDGKGPMIASLVGFLLSYLYFWYFIVWAKRLAR